MKIVVRFSVPGMSEQQIIENQILFEEFSKYRWNLPKVLFKLLKPKHFFMLIILLHYYIGSIWNIEKLSTITRNHVKGLTNFNPKVRFFFWFSINDQTVYVVLKGKIFCPKLCLRTAGQCLLCFGMQKSKKPKAKDWTLEKEKQTHSKTIDKHTEMSSSDF